MFLAVGLGPAGYALGIFHLLTHGFFKAGLFLGAGSVMHAMHDEVDMRRFGGLARYLPITFATFGLRLPRADRLPVPVGLLLQGRDHRGRVRAGGLAGLGVRRRRHPGRRAHRLLHDPAGAHDVLRRAAVEEARQSADGHDYHPHESPADDDDPDDRAGVRVGRRGCVLLGDRPAPSGSPRRSASSDRAPEGRRRSRTRWCPWLVVAFSALGVLIAWLTVGRHRVPVERPAHVSLPVRAARRDLYANAINEALIARPGIWLDPRAGLLRQPRRRRAGQRHGRGAGRQLRAGCAGCRPASSARTR